MRRLTLFGVIISAAITLFTGCNPDEAPMPKLTSTTEENISVPAGESKAVITYDLENPAENGDLKATANRKTGSETLTIQKTVKSHSKLPPTTPRKNVKRQS